MEFTTSEKLNPLNLIDGYNKYCFHKILSNNIQSWTYNMSRQKCYLKLNSNNEILKINTNRKHNKIEVLLLEGKR